MKYKTWTAKDFLQKICQILGNFPVLREDKDTFMLVADRLTDFPQHFEFAAFLFRIFTEPHKLVGMVADLLEPANDSQHKSLSLYAFKILEAFLKLIHLAAVQCRLSLGQCNVVYGFHLVRQIGNDRLVRLKAAKYKRRDHPLKLHITIRLKGQALCKVAELLCRSQKPLVKEVKQ